jgi:hypothetical protein
MSVGRLMPVDSDGDGPAPDSASLLQDIANDIAESLPVEEVTFEVSGRPGYAVRYSLDFDVDDVKRWRKAAGASKTQEADEVRMAAVMLATQCSAIIRRGEEVRLDGEVLTFRSKSFHEALDVPKSADAVLKFYGRDLHATQVANELLLRVGQKSRPDEADEDEDPTQG